MNDFPTWQVWQLIHAIPTEKTQDADTPILHEKQERSLLNNVWIWVIISFFLNSVNHAVFIKDYALYSWVAFIAIHLFITLICLRFGIQVAELITTKGETEKLPTVLDIMRAHRHSIKGKPWGIRAASIVALPTMYIAVIAVIPKVSMFFLVNWAIYYGFAHFIDYLQAFTAITLITILVNQHLQRTQTQARTIGYFLALQAGLYIVNVILGLLCVTILSLSGIDNILPFFHIVTLTLIKPLSFILCRELVNFVLWQAVKHRLEA